MANLIRLASIEMSDDPRVDYPWLVTFALDAAPLDDVRISVPVDRSCPEDAILQVGRHKFHALVQRLAADLAGWESDESEIRLIETQG